MQASDFYSGNDTRPAEARQLPQTSRQKVVTALYPCCIRSPRNDHPAALVPDAAALGRVCAGRSGCGIVAVFER